MVWLPDGEKSLKICLVGLTEFTNVTDGQTDRQHDSIGHACIASHGKNGCVQLTSSLLTVGTGVIGAHTGPMPSQNVYSAQSVLIIVQEAPSLIISLDTPLGQGAAYNHINKQIHFYADSTETFSHLM